jgi:hypothetical protein
MSVSPDRISQPGFPTLTHVWVAAAFTVILVRALAWPIPPNDFWWQLAYGRWIVENGEIPRVDHFSFTQAGQPHFDQPWLAQVALYGVYRLGEAGLSLLVLAGLLVAAYGPLLRLCAGRTGNLKLSAGLMLVSLPVAMTNWSVRSQMLALPLFVATMTVLSRWRLGPGAETKQVGRSGGRASGNNLWLLPIIMVLWVNLHGSFVLGGVLIGTTFVVEAASKLLRRRSADDSGSAGLGEDARLRSLLLWGGITAAAMLVNPRGPDIFRYVFGLLGNPAIGTIVTEWAPPTTESIVGRIFFGYAILLALAASFGSRPDPVDTVLAVVFFWLALSGERHIIWFAIVSLPLLVTQFASFPLFEGGAPTRGKRAVNAGLLTVMLAAVLLVLPPIKTAIPFGPALQPLIAPATPIRAVAAHRVSVSPPERLFHTEAAGSYLMWAAPESKVFVDVRVLLYPYAQLSDYRWLSAGIMADSLLDHYGIDGLLLDNERQANLLEWARESDEWLMRYQDSLSSYLVKRQGLAE